MRIDITPLVKKSSKTIEININRDRTRINQEINDSKMCLNILFPESNGENVEFTASFVRGAKYNPARFCVDGITRENGLHCADVNEEGEEPAHMWLEVDIDSANSQIEKWRKLQVGQRIKISGELASYSDKKGYYKRKVINPVILD